MLTSAPFALVLLPALAYAQVATRTIIITAPVDEITSIANAIPKSLQLQQTEQVGGQILPITINDYVTSIVIPAAASIPAGITLSPISPVLVPVPTPAASVSQLVSAASNGVNAKESSIKSVVASETAAVRATATSEVAVVIDTATSLASVARSAGSAEASSVNSIVASLTSGKVLPSPFIPVPVPNPSSVFQSVASELSSVSSEVSSRVAQVSSDLVATSAVITSVISGVSSEIVVATSIARSRVSSQVADFTSILSDSSAAARTTTPTSLQTRTLSSTLSTTVSSSATTAAESSASSEASSSSTPAASSASSTAAPNSGARVGRVEDVVLGLAVGAVSWLMI